MQTVILHINKFNNSAEFESSEIRKENASLHLEVHMQVSHCQFLPPDIDITPVLSAIRNLENLL